jgi:hypothetical protein
VRQVYHTVTCLKTSKYSFDKQSIAKKKDQKRSSTGFINLVAYDLSLECENGFLGNSILQKANQYLCFPENLLGIPNELPTIVGL